MKNKTVAGLLALFLGGIGAHKFYLERSGQGLIYLLFVWTFIPAIIGFFEGLSYFFMSQESFDAKYNASQPTAMSKSVMIKEKADGTTVGICPFCKEEVQPEATKCKHCGSALGAQSTATVPAGNSISLGKIILVVLLIGILSSVVLASLNEARDKAEQASKSSSQTDSATTTKEAEKPIVWDNPKAKQICEEYPEWSKNDCEKVAEGGYWIGMHYDMLVYQLGKPDSANPSNYGYGVEWQWCWYDSTPSCFYGDDDKIVDSYN